MRIRSTKPEFWRSERIAAVDWDARLVLKGLESYVDDNGVGKDDLALICGDLFMRDLVREPSRTLARVSEAISALYEAGLIHRYAHDGTQLLYLSFWETAQRVDKPQPGRFPRPDGTFNYKDSIIRESSRTVANVLELSRLEQGNRGTGEQGGGPSAPSPHCKRHPEGTDKPCSACKRARVEFDTAWESALKEKPSTPAVKAPATCPHHPEWPLPCQKCADIASEVA